MFKRLFQKKRSAPIVIVSGLPRSGTSMMMKMLEAGGIPPLQDGVRSADNDNPRGYYEFERVKQLDKGDTAWLESASGKVVKVISALVPHLPEGHQYKILFMRRDIDEVLASQAKMLVNRDEERGVSDDEMKQLYRKHLKQIFAWTAMQEHISVLDVDYRGLINDPSGQAGKIDAFLGNTLDVPAMLAVIDPSLYRNRGSG